MANDTVNDPKHTEEGIKMKTTINLVEPMDSWTIFITELWKLKKQRGTARKEDES